MIGVKQLHIYILLVESGGRKTKSNILILRDMTDACRSRPTGEAPFFLELRSDDAGSVTAVAVASSMKTTPNNMLRRRSSRRQAKHRTDETRSLSDDPFALLSEDELDDKDLLTMKIRNSSTSVGRLSLERVSSRLLDDNDFMSSVLAAVPSSHRYHCLQYASIRIRLDDRFVLSAMMPNDGTSASRFLRHADHDVVVAAMAKDGYGIKHLSDHQKDYRRIVMAAVTQNGYALKYASRRLRDDVYIVRAAAAQDGRALQFATARLRYDRDILLAVLRSDDSVSLPRCFRDDDELVLAAVTRNGYRFQHASLRLKDDKDIAIAAVSQRGCERMLTFASARLQADTEVVSAVTVN